MLCQLFKRIFYPF